MKYRPNWTQRINETPVETVTNDNTERLASSSTAAGAKDEQDAIGTYTGTDKASPESDGQSDYQKPLSSVASDQWSSYDPCLRKQDVTRDDQVSTTALAGGVSNQCYDEDMPYYVNTSELAADAAGDDDDDDDAGAEGHCDDDDDGGGGDAAGDAGSGEYMQVLTCDVDDEVDNVYLSLLDIVSIAERQIQVSGTTTTTTNYYHHHHHHFFRNICKPDSCLHHLLPPPRDLAVTSRLRKPTVYPRPSLRTKR